MSGTGLTSLAEHVALWLHRLAALTIALLVVLINADVFSRSVFDLPLRGVTEVVSLGIPASVFLSAGWLLGANKLIRAELAMVWLAKNARPAALLLQGLFEGIAALLAVAMLVAAWPVFTSAFATDEFVGVEGDFTVPVWPVKFIIALGCVVLAVLSGTAATARFRETVAACGRLRSAWRTLLVFALALLSCLLGYAVAGDSRAGVGAVSIGVLFALVYGGMPVAFALLGAAFLGIGLIRQDFAVAVAALGFVADGAVTEYVFAAVPLFIFMGLVVGAADFGRDSLQAAQWLLRGVKGGLGVATVAANAVFAAITGISIASAAIFSKVAVPPLIEHGFTPRFAVGLVAGSSVLGMLIPPSLLLIIYGIVAEVSVGSLFVAAIGPGLMLAAAFALAVTIVARFEPAFAITRGAGVDLQNGIGGRAAGVKALPVGLLIAAVLGGIYGGVFTPTEAGGVGALGALLIGLVMGRTKVGELGRLLLDAAASSASILLLIVAASAFAIMLTLSGIPSQLGGVIAGAGFSLTTYAMGYVLMLIVLGMVLDSTSILLIMVPLALPTVQLLGGDLVWFGIVTVIGVEIGLLTPPLGLSVYAIKASLDDQTISLNDIFVGAVPFTLIMFAVTALLIVFPVISVGLL